MFARLRTATVERGGSVRRAVCPPARPSAAEVIGAGRPLRASEVPVQARGYGHDFSHVRIHAGAGAQAAADAIGANAFTWGEHVVLSSRAGRDTIAHELAHVVQQSGARGGTPDVAPPDGALERDAEVAATSGRPPQLRAGGRIVQREESIIVQQLSAADHEKLTGYLAKHGFGPRAPMEAEFDGFLMNAKLIASQAKQADMAKNRLDLIEKDVQQRITAGWRDTGIPAVTEHAKSKPQWLLDKLVPTRPTGPSAADGPVQMPPSVASSSADLARTASRMPDDSIQPFTHKIGLPGPTGTPGIPVPTPGKDAESFTYSGLLNQYKSGQQISFSIVAPERFWSLPGDDKVATLLPPGSAQPLTQLITKEKASVKWSAPYVAGKYRVAVVAGQRQPETRSYHPIDVVAP